MAEHTGIAWTDHTFNPWIGCTKVSCACDHCYAETLVNGRMGGNFSQRRRTSALNWKQPLRWNRAAEAAGVHRRVFCASLADVFDNQAPAEWRDDLWALIRVTPHLTWQLLTKRPQNISKMLPPDWTIGWDNVWLGITAEDQPRLAERAWVLSQIPAALRFLSYEPALAPLDARQVKNRWGTVWDALTGRILHAASGPSSTDAISWVICGGESGPGARPMHPDWARGLRDQCAAAGVPFFFKQWGEWTPGENVERQRGTVETAHWFDGGWSFDRENLARTDGHIDDEPDLYRVGKRTAGSRLDGREHLEFPTVGDLP